MCRPTDPCHVSGDRPWLWPSIMTIADPPPVTDTVRTPVTLIGADASLSRWRSGAAFLEATPFGRADCPPERVVWALSPDAGRFESSERAGGGAVFGKMSNVLPPDEPLFDAPAAEPCGVAPPILVLFGSPGGGAVFVSGCDGGGGLAGGGAALLAEAFPSLPRSRGKTSGDWLSAAFNFHQFPTPSRTGWRDATASTARTLNMPIRTYGGRRFSTTVSR